MYSKQDKRHRILFLQIYGGGGILGGTETYLKNLFTEIKHHDPSLELLLAVFNKKDSIFTQLVDRIEDSVFTRFLDSWQALRLQYRFRILGSISFLWGLVWFYHTAKLLIQDKRIDYIYANGGHLSALVAYFLHKTFHIRYIVHIHGVFNFSELFTDTYLSPRKLLLASVTRNMLEEASHVIANSKDVYDDIAKVKSDVSNCSIVHCFVNRNIFFPREKQEMRAALHLPKKTFIILSANRLDKSKKLPFLIESVKGMKQKVICLIIGDGQLRSDVEALAGKDSRFIYYRQIVNEDLSKYICAADIVWGVCSVYYMCMTLIESLACGVPVMASQEPSPIDVEWGKKVVASTLPSRIGHLVPEVIPDMSKLLDRLALSRGQLKETRSACLAFYDEVYGQKNIHKVLHIMDSLNAETR